MRRKKRYLQPKFCYFITILRLLDLWKTQLRLIASCNFHPEVKVLFHIHPKHLTAAKI